MLSNISNFCTTIIFTTLTIIILEMVMPEGKSKKYVSFVKIKTTKKRLLLPLFVKQPPGWIQISFYSVIAHTRAGRPVAPSILG